MLANHKFKKFLLLIFYLLVAVESEQSENLNSSLLSGPKCEALLMDYAVLTGNFTKCLIQHARPITVCQNCVSSYFQVVDSYTNITKLKDEDTGEACKLELINVDRLEVIEENFKYVTLEWERASCHKCFDAKTTELNSDTEEILRLQNVTENCIREREHDSVICNPSSSVCFDCLESYRHLNDFYDTHKSYNGFCMDIVDMMNATRYNWSITLCCCTDRRKPEPLYLVAYFSVFLIPVIFYVVVLLSSRSYLSLSVDS